MRENSIFFEGISFIFIFNHFEHIYIYIISAVRIFVKKFCDEMIKVS